MLNNKVDDSKVLLEKYSKERNSWDDFYKSERYVMDSVLGELQDFSILDAGCGCGGLLKAIQDRYSIKYYTGIDLDKEMIAYAQNRNDLFVNNMFECIDICNLKDRLFDVVISFGSIDWYDDPFGALESCWSCVKPGGLFISSFRLTERESIFHEAFQIIQGSEERHNYVVFNFFDLKNTLCSLNPPMMELDCYGYWGKPSQTAVVDRDRLCFSVFAMRKSKQEVGEVESRMILNLPIDAF